jgi:phosphoglycerol transferase
MKLSPAFRSFLEVCLIILISLLLTTYFLELWSAEWRVPFQYVGGDSFQTHEVIKSIIDTGSYLENPLLGAPGKLEYYDFPRTDHIQVLIVRFLSLFTSDFALLVNIFFVVTFPLTAAIAFLVLRHFRISFLSALILSLLYSMLPYHFGRGQVHFFLNFYSFVPLGVAMALWIARSDPFVTKNAKGKLRPTKIAIAATLFSLLIASAGTYYTFFSCFAVLVAGLYAFFRSKNYSQLITAALIVLLMICFALLNLVPILRYWQREGKNPVVSTRLVVEAETHGLNLTGLLLPGTGHRFQPLNRMMRKYPQALMGENRMAYLGIVGVAGFVMLLKWLFFPTFTNKDELKQGLSILNGAFLLLGLSGGIGLLFAFVVFSQFRAYNRVSIFLGFISLFAVALILDQLRARLSRSSNVNIITITLALAILAFGLWDQTIPAYAVLKPKQIADFRSDAAFVKQIESILPAGSTIFQLPYHPFPESEAQHRMKDYDHFRGYLHSSRLRWSYGTIKGRKWDIWQRHIQKLALPEFLKTLRQAGFRGLYFDRYGYSRKSNDEQNLKTQLGEPILESEDERLIFFLL